MDTPTMARRPARTRRHAGFTITELLVVIAIIGLIVTLLIPTINKVRSRARTMKCLTNQRQITQANYAYTGDNNGRFVSPRTDSFGSMYVNGTNVPNSTTHCWVSAQGANVTGAFERVSALEQGKLWPYIGNVQAYLSPDEPTNAYGNLTSDANTRVRSYSFNACLGVTRPDELPDYDNAFMNPLSGSAGATSVPLSTYNTQTVARVLQPARMMSTLVEDDNVAWNNEGWIINPQPASRLWVDLPAPWRPDAVTLTYVDGSTDVREMVNPDICATNYGAPFPAGMIVGGPGPHNARAPIDTSGTDTDWRWFRERLNPGILPMLPNFPTFPE
ncbi:MAG: type II secretion system protein [Phycisphaerales bacterium]